MSSRPGALLGLALALALVASACGSDDGALRCGPGTVERNAQCVVAGGGRGGAAASRGGHGAALAGEDTGGGAAASAGESSGRAGQAADAGRASSSGGRHTAGTGGSSGRGGDAAHADDGVSGDHGAAGAGAAQGGASEGGQASSFGAADEGGAPDLGEGPTPCTTEPIHCETGDALPASGRYTVPQTDTLLGLSDTTVLVGNTDSNTLDVVDICTAGVRWSWQLPTAPGTAILDRSRRLLYVTLTGATSIAQISLDSARVELIEVPAPAIALAFGNGGLLFARLDDYGPFDWPISIIDGNKRRVLTTRRGDFDEFIAFYRAGNRLITGSRYGGLKAFDFAPATREFTPAEATGETSEPCYEIALAPDEARVFFACDNGISPTPPEQDGDFDPADLTKTFGYYEPGISVTAADYSPGGAHLFASIGAAVAEFDVSTHTRIDTITITGTNRHVAVAPSGRVLFTAGTSFVGTKQVSLLNWSLTDEPYDCAP
jgi:hypothetical protein